jgi:beta-glucosidase
MLKYKDLSLPTEERMNDLLQRMSFEQKIDQITCLVTITPDIPEFKDYIPNGIGNVGAFTIAENADKIAEYVYRLQKFLVEETPLGIPALIHCEACAGAQFTEADVFPSAIAQASTFDTEVIKSMSELIREQMTAVGFRQALSPVFDIARDTRWGRITETYGEDPTLTSAMGSAFVSGIQTDDLKNGIIATAKHFVGHGITEGGINMGRNLITERELLEVHCKPFQAAITEGGMRSVMNSYCSMNGEPVIGSRKILTEILRDNLGFAGFVVSDYISLDRMVDPFRVADTYEKAGIRAVKAGLDVEYPRPKGFTYQLKEAVENGELDMETIDSAVRRVLKAKFDLGLFENPYPDLDKLHAALHRKEIDELNETIAKESIILLKNDHKTLPLNKDIKKLAVIGPHGDSVRSYFGTFSYPAVLDMTMSRDEDGQVFEEEGLIIYDIEQKYIGQVREVSPRVEKRIRSEFKNARSLYQALKEYLPDTEVMYSKGINCAGTDIGGMEEALRCAAQADVVLLTLGGKNGWGVTSTVGEGVDSTSIDLPGKQEEFARKVRALNKKTVVLHFDGRALSNEYVASGFDAILEVWQAGEMGGQALCKVLFGEYNPAGRLPVTAPRNVGQLPVYYSLPRGSGYVGAGHTGMIRNPNGYINDTAFPLYYFGHGLSYTGFEYGNLRLADTEVSADGTIKISVDVTNTGDYDGDEVVQLYYSDEVASMVRPELELAGFKRVNLKKEETKTVTFTMKTSQMAFLNEAMDWVVEEGYVTLLIGASSQDIRLKDRVKIRDTKVIDQKQRGFYAEAEAAQ